MPYTRSGDHAPEYFHILNLEGSDVLSLAGDGSPNIGLPDRIRNAFGRAGIPAADLSTTYELLHIDRYGWVGATVLSMGPLAGLLIWSDKAYAPSIPAHIISYIWQVCSPAIGASEVVSLPEVIEVRARTGA